MPITWLSGTIAVSVVSPNQHLELLAILETTMELQTLEKSQMG